MTEWVGGQPAKWVTELEPEFDANERDNWYAMWEYEQSLCPQCGRLRSVCEDPDAAFNPQIDTCYATVAQATYSRRWQRRFEKVQPDSDGWHPTDGAIVWVSEDLPPEPTFGLQSAVESAT